MVDLNTTPINQIKFRFIKSGDSEPDFPVYRVNVKGTGHVLCTLTKGYSRNGGTGWQHKLSTVSFSNRKDAARSYLATWRKQQQTGRGVFLLPPTKNFPVDDAAAVEPSTKPNPLTCTTDGCVLVLGHSATHMNAEQVEQHASILSKKGLLHFIWSNLAPGEHAVVRDGSKVHPKFNSRTSYKTFLEYIVSLTTRNS